MKSHITLAFLFFLITACGGNPHIYSSRGGLERSNPPLVSNQEEDSGCRAGRSLMGYEFSFSSHTNGSADMYPAGFLKYLKCKTLIRESFNDFEVGFTFLISNRNRFDHSYELTHLTERKYPDQKILYLEDIFNAESFPMEVEKVLTQEAITGKDQGVDSNDASVEAKDALLWSYSAPVITWGVHVLNLASTINQPANLRLFDCDRTLIKEVKIIYPQAESGENEKHFIGFVGGAGEVCHVSLTSSHNLGVLAVDELIYGK